MDLNFNSTRLQKVSDIQIPDIFNRRLKTGINKIDSLFDEGILPGSALTLTAPAGCGKTTFMLQVLQGLTKNGYNVGYFSGEESIYQLAYTARRVESEDVQIANVTDIDEIKSHMSGDLDFVVVDSFQALTTSKKMNSRQLEKYAVQELTRHSKETECTIVFIMHLTKSGDLKGGTIVPHTVDANLKIVRNPEADDDAARIVFFEKNRFGPLNELECLIERAGFNFDAEVLKTETEKAPSKKNRKKNDLDLLMNTLKESGCLTVVDAGRALEGNVNRARHLLREQEIMGSIVKTGRGVMTIWKESDVA
jgi:predicted ATP-dependent serine protease